MEPSSYFNFPTLGGDPIFEIALNMPFEQLRLRCIYDQNLKSICMNQEFWLQRLKREYLKLLSYKPVDMNYFQYYNALETKSIKFVNVGYNGKIIGLIPMYTTDLISTVNSRAIDLVSSMGLNLDDAKLDDMVFLKHPGEWANVTLEGYPINKSPIGYIPNESVYYKYEYEEGMPTFWDSLEVISIYQTKLYPDHGPIFKK
jgi:hypothetical protein